METPELATTAILGPERSSRRDGLHVLAVAMPWTLVVYLWWRVLTAGGPVTLGTPLLFVAVSLAVTGAVTAAWIRHNVGIHRTKGPRTGLPSVEASYEHDWTGRHVVAEWSALRTAPVVLVAASKRDKAFVPSRAPSAGATGDADRSAPAPLASRS